mmetsp:Transcript_840/g.1918  ORF Transcript_840/g.1918 Transcript_840/m.1918 type:complete len:302 (-) Transcript_840:128-1033(-)|eukprot:CAMPEP_0171514166 /NCGR_PEP_ID=MMETSP0959-20130129/2681_1 /TAXON_ID=87120 /ORGANISM="Aurantiochytrium limacinum, Strain ATCCMYA-1381" /LENGTH=301 /DNA_ID=CAMNT_0012052437 /DNA_START=60 /DNA_END=965 /DNA_ORIENTATION=+
MQEMGRMSETTAVTAELGQDMTTIGGEDNTGDQALDDQGDLQDGVTEIPVLQNEDEAMETRKQNAATANVAHQLGAAQVPNGGISAAAIARSDDVVGQTEEVLNDQVGGECCKKYSSVRRRLKKAVETKSISKHFCEAKKEWVLTGHRIAPKADGQCTCGKRKLKDVFVLSNSNTGLEIVVGSTCITHFPDSLSTNIDIDISMVFKNTTPCGKSSFGYATEGDKQCMTQLRTKLRRKFPQTTIFWGYEDGISTTMRPQVSFKKGKIYKSKIVAKISRVKISRKRDTTPIRFFLSVQNIQEA